MGLAAVVRSGIATAKSVTADLQANISHYAWIDDGAYGAPVYADAVTLSALVEAKQRLIRLPSGEEVMSQAKVTILQPVTANGATGRREPIDPRDKIVLPDGTTGPILGVEGLIDPGTSAPYMLGVWLG